MQHVRHLASAALLSDLALDPPNNTQDLAGPPLREEDYLILSTIHSAKGCEWDCVYVIHAADGNIHRAVGCRARLDVYQVRKILEFLFETVGRTKQLRILNSEF